MPPSQKDEIDRIVDKFTCAVDATVGGLLAAAYAAESCGLNDLATKIWGLVVEAEVLQIAVEKTRSSGELAQVAAKGLRRSAKTTGRRA